MKKADQLDTIAARAMAKGATHAKIISTRKVAVDERARLKCLVPLCSCYGRHLLCPPNVLTPGEFSGILALYDHALIVQVEADFDSTDKSREGLSKELCETIEHQTGSAVWQRKLHRIVNDVEAFAFKKGYRFAAGLIGGECSLCPECNALDHGRRCKHPFLARPSMEALGIDVIKTCGDSGLRIDLSSKTHVMWTGLVLID